MPPDPQLNSQASAAFSMEGDSGRAADEPRRPNAQSLSAPQEPGSREEEEARQRHELCEAMAAIHQRGWCDGTGGNFSCVLQREPLLLLMAPSGVDKGSVQPQELIVVDGEGMVFRGSGRASAETLLHLAIVKETGAGAVLHTHSQAGTLLSQWSWERRLRAALAAGAVRSGTKELREAGSSLQGGGGSRSNRNEACGLEESGSEDAVAFVELRNLEMLKGIAGITTHQSEVRIPVLGNDQDLSELSRRACPHLSQAPAGLLIAGHGLYAWGGELNEARRHLEILEFLLEQRWRQLLLEALVGRGMGAAAALNGTEV